jgi:2-oxoglutarate/2-oxoacid ferredoxin oxidoreductase subunit alpha
LHDNAGFCSIRADVRRFSTFFLLASSYPTVALYPLELAPPDVDAEERWAITGNQAAGLGVLRAGVRFVAAYPITPATEIL